MIYTLHFSRHFRGPKKKFAGFSVLLIAPGDLATTKSLPGFLFFLWKRSWASTALLYEFRRLSIERIFFAYNAVCTLYLAKTDEKGSSGDLAERLFSQASKTCTKIENKKFLWGRSFPVFGCSSLMYGIA